MVNYIGLKADGMNFDAHLTMLYTGELEGTLIKQHAQNLVERWGGYEGGSAVRKELAQFGTKTVVLVDVPDWVHTMREMFVKNWMNPSEQKREWHPHITIKINHSEDIIIPKLIPLHSLGLY